MTTNVADIIKLYADIWEAAYHKLSDDEDSIRLELFENYGDFDDCLELLGNDHELVIKYKGLTN